MLVGKAKDHFEICQGELGDDSQEFEKLLDKVRDFARHRKLDHNVTKAVSCDSSAVPGTIFMPLSARVG